MPAGLIWAFPESKSRWSVRMSMTRPRRVILVWTLPATAAAHHRLGRHLVVGDRPQVGPGGRLARLVALGRRDERQQLLGDDPRVVARLDGEDALEDHRPRVGLAGAERLEPVGNGVI